MKRILLTATMLIFLFLSLGTLSQDCKPDVFTQDKMTKEQIFKWEQVLNSTNLLQETVMEEDLTFTFMIGRYGGLNAINIEIVKWENKVQRSNYETPFKASQGDQFVLGFKNGQPIAFTADEVNNLSSIEKLTGNLRMVAVWSDHLTDQELGKLRSALTTNQIDAVRVTMGSVRVDKAVKEKNGRKAMEKINCFYQLLDKSGISLAPTNETSGQPANTEQAAGSGTPPNQPVQEKLQESQVSAVQVICHFCKAKNNPGSKFCSACGKDIEPITCPKCKTVSPADTQYCPQCGQKLKEPASEGESKK